MTKQQILLNGLAFAVALVYLIWMVIKDAPTLRSMDGVHEDGPADRTEAPAAPLQAPSTGESSPLPVGAPPDTYKTYRLLITRCPDPFMWYRDLVGKEVPYLGTWPSEDCHKSREPAGFINIVKIADARIVIREENAK